MLTEKTFAFVLDRKPFKEFHQVLWLFTDRLGLIMALGYGMSHFGSRRSSHLDTGNFCELELEKRKEYFSIRHALAVETYPRIKQNLFSAGLILTLLHLLSKILPLEMPLHSLFTFLKETFGFITQKPLANQREMEICYRNLEKKILEILGYQSRASHVRPEHIRDHLERSEEALKLFVGVDAE